MQPNCNIYFFPAEDCTFCYAPKTKFVISYRFVIRITFCVSAEQK